MYFIFSYKCVVGEVGSYCQLAVTFTFIFWSHLTKPDNVVFQFILTPPFCKSGSAPVAESSILKVLYFFETIRLNIIIGSHMMGIYISGGEQYSKVGKGGSISFLHNWNK